MTKTGISGRDDARTPSVLVGRDPELETFAKSLRRSRGRRQRLIFARRRRRHRVAAAAGVVLLAIAGTAIAVGTVGRGQERAAAQPDARG